MTSQGKRRALGQHFLRDQGVADSIANAALEEATRFSCPGLLEIGPGKGAITLPLLRGLQNHPGLQKFLLVERDPALAASWKNHDSSFPFQVEVGDFLDLSAEHWLKSKPLAVVSNLPYSSGTAILTRMAQHFQDIPVMVLMFQEEVAKRVRAEPSTPDRGSLSLWIQNRWDVKKFLSVPPRAFAPPPKVNSEVVILTSRSEPRIQMTAGTQDEALWQSLLRSCFAHRRKMLRSVIHLRNAFAISQVDDTKRAEALDWNEWGRLFQAVKQGGASVSRPD